VDSQHTAERLDSGVGSLVRPEQKPTDETLANRMRKTRRSKSWTQQKLADLAHTTQAVIQKIENGKSLRPRNIVALAKALEVDPSWLMFGASETESISPEAVAVAKAWSELPEPQRSSVKDQVMRLSRSF
jgi:transcriptional regulator with XRE-family HTH domain